MKLGDLCAKKAVTIQNGFPCGEWNGEARGLLQIRPFNVSDFGQIDLTICKHIETERNIEPYALQINDVIFNNTNSEELVGKTALWVSTNKAVLSNHMTIVRVADRAAADARFIAFYLLYMWYHGYFRMVCRRHVNQASVSRERLCETPLPDFDVDRQRRIAGVLTAVQHAVEQKGRVIALTGKLEEVPGTNAPYRWDPR